MIRHGDREGVTLMDPTDREADVTAPGVAQAGRREWIGLAVLALACLLYAMDLTVLHLAVPSLSAELQPSGAELLWITDIYGFMVAGFLVTMGTLGDRIGRRRLLLLGAAAFAAPTGSATGSLTLRSAAASFFSVVASRLSAAAAFLSGADGGRAGAASSVMRPTTVPG